MLLTTLLSFMMIGCSPEFKLQIDSRLPLPPAVPQTPLHVGVRYAPEFVDFTEKIELIACGPSGRRDKTGVFFIFPIGAASKDLFDQVIGGMFTAVTGISDLSEVGNIPSIQGLFEPRIGSFSWGIVCSENYLSTGRYYARVNYVIDLRDPDGNLVSTMYVEGFGNENSKLCFLDCKNSFGSVQAMHDAMARFMIEFREQPEVKKWIATHDERHDKPR